MKPGEIEVVSESYPTRGPRRAELKPKSVCSGCNNGWMSQLEERVQPFLTAMILDHAVTVEVEQQRLLSRWLACKAMVVDNAQDSDKPRFFAEADRRHLREQGEPPASVWGVWIGRCSGRIDVFTGSCSLWDLSFPGCVQKPCTGYAVTFGLGCFVGQVLGVRHKSKPIPLFDPLPPRQYLTQIRLPVSSISWPQTLPFDGSSDSLRTIAHRFIQP